MSLLTFLIVCVGMRLVETFSSEPCVWTKDSYGYANVANDVDNLDWTLVCGNTTGGPVGGIDGDDDCYLALSTGSSNSLADESAVLLSPCYKWVDSGSPNHQPGVQFYYFPYLVNVASLNVYWRPECIAPSLLSNRDEWQEFALTSKDTNDDGWQLLASLIPEPDGEFQFQILLEAVIGNSSVAGFIGIDKMVAGLGTNCSLPGQLFCDKSNCIVNGSICDENVDCIDNADESSCGSNGALSSSTIQMATSSSATTTPIDAYTTMMDVSNESTTFIGSSPIHTTEILTTDMTDTTNVTENTSVTTNSNTSFDQMQTSQIATQENAQSSKTTEISTTNTEVKTDNHTSIGTTGNENRIIAGLDDGVFIGMIIAVGVVFVVLVSCIVVFTAKRFSIQPRKTSALSDVMHDTNIHSSKELPEQSDWVFTNTTENGCAIGETILQTEVEATPVMDNNQRLSTSSFVTDSENKTAETLCHTKTDKDSDCLEKKTSDVMQNDYDTPHIDIMSSTSTSLSTNVEESPAKGAETKNSLDPVDDKANEQTESKEKQNSPTQENEQIDSLEVSVDKKDDSFPLYSMPNKGRKQSQAYSEIKESPSKDMSESAYEDVKLGDIAEAIEIRRPTLPQGHPSFRQKAKSDAHLEADPKDVNGAISNPMSVDSTDLEPYAETSFASPKPPCENVTDPTYATANISIKPEIDSKPASNTKPAAPTIASSHSAGMSTTKNTDPISETTKGNTEIHLLNEDKTHQDANNVQKNSNEENNLDESESGWVENTIYSSVDNGK